MRVRVLAEKVQGWGRSEDLLPHRTYPLSTCLASVAVELERIEEDNELRQLFLFQAPTANVYPLLIGAQARGILDDQMIQAISLLDLRVYQVRGTSPKAELFRTAIASMKTGERADILHAILVYCRDFGSDAELDANLRRAVYRESFAKFVLWSFCKGGSNGNAGDVGLYRSCQIDHIFPQDFGEFDIRGCGFGDKEEYLVSNHRFGNLTL